jgi:hypothetical protein
MRPLNILLFALGPSLYFRHQADKDVDEKVTEMWRVHRNRERAGKITNTKDNIWAQNHRQGETVAWNIAITIPLQ